MYKCYIQDQILWIEQDSAYEACHHTHMSLHLPLHIRDVQKKHTLPCFIQKASRCAADCMSKTTVIFIFQFL